MIHIYVPLVHGDTNSQITTVHIIIIIITWMLGTQLSHDHTSLLRMLTTRVYLHVLSLSYYHMTHRLLFHVTVFLLYACFSWLLLLCPLLDIVIPVTDMDIPVTGHESC